MRSCAPEEPAKPKRRMVGRAAMVFGLVLMATDLSSALDPVQMPVQLDPMAPKHRLPAKHHKQQRRPQAKQQHGPPPREASPEGEAMLAHNVQRPERFDPAKHPRVTALDTDADGEDGTEESRTPKLAYNVHRPERYDPKAHPRQHPELAHELAARPRPEQEDALAEAAAEPAWEPTQGRTNRK